jgi:microcystin-dependent protein
MSIVNAHPVRVRTSDGWQELALTGPQGPPGPAGGIPGEVKLWPGTSLPDPVKYGKWVWADGGSYDSATYPEASANIASQWKTAFGVADPGAGKFRVPDLRGVVPCGMDQMPGGTRANRVTRAAAVTIATFSGEEYHTLSVAELASHNHGAATGTESADHTHTVTTGLASAGHVHYSGSAQGSVGGWVSAQAASGGAHAHTMPPNTLYNDQAGQYAFTTTNQTGMAGVVSRATDAPAHTHYAADFSNYASGAHQDHSHSGTTSGRSSVHTHAISAQGGGGAHENLPPTVFVPYIVRLDG